MHLNILKPRDAVEEAFKRPETVKAIAIVFFSALANAFTAVILGLNINLSQLIVNTEIRTFAAFLFYYAIIAMAGIALKKKWGNLSSLVSSLSLINIVDFVAKIVLSIGVLLTVPKQAIQTITTAILQGNLIDAATGESLLSQFNIVGLIIVLAISFIFVLIQYYLLYLTIKKHLSLQTTTAIVVFFLIVFLASYVFLPASRVLLG